MPSDIKKYLAVDLGASSGRVIVGRLEGARMTIEEAHRFQTPSYKRSGHFHWDLQALTDHILTGIEHALKMAPDARSVSVDSWAVDYVVLDSSGRPVSDPYCYRDSRNVPMMDLAFKTVSRERLYEITGLQFLPFNSLFQFLADKTHDPEQFRRAASRLLIADYFNYLLSGKAVIDLSNASTTHMVDARTQSWSTAILNSFGIAAETMPEIVPSGTILGESTKHPGLKVIATCSHDTGAAVAAIPADESRSDWAYISSGTWSLLGLELEDPLLSMDAMEAGFTNEIGLDGKIRFLKNLSGLWILQECMREWQANEPNYSWSDLIEAARASNAGSVRVDVDDPRFMAPIGMLDRLASYFAERGLSFPAEKGPLARILLESLADAYAAATKLASEVSGRTIKTLHIVGGGSQNDLLCQLAANVTGCTVHAGPVEATALGNLLVQARTLGDLPDDISIRKVVRRSFELNTYNPK